MPAGSPFTALCQAMARGPGHGRADLHLHTTASDGLYAPRELVDLGKRCGLAAIAVTDHDTFAGVAEAQAAARGSPLEVVAGVELSCWWRGRDLHLLAWFADPDHPALAEALRCVLKRRQERFAATLERLRRLRVSVQEEERPPASLGRRYLAELLVAQGHAESVREAFSRWLGSKGEAFVPWQGLPVEEAIAAVRAAGGVAAWAHPPYDASGEALSALAAMGMQAVETAYPNARPSFAKQLRLWARHLGLATTGGSDCHGPGARGVGSVTASGEEWAALRAKAGRS
ncbi:MAG: PHP domain-containing protein [Gemmataceae bacterium]|nr:PHP domain-containing protein [Gemmataceae bacterium]